jgi:branched-chain amino acid transport system permease protein
MEDFLMRVDPRPKEAENLVRIGALGGFGSERGAFFAGLVVGMITEIPGFWDFITYTFNLDWMANVPMTSFKYMWVYLAYFLIMVIRPRGLFGWKQ